MAWKGKARIAYQTGARSSLGGIARGRGMRQAAAPLQQGVRRGHDRPCEREYDARTDGKYKARAAFRLAPSQRGERGIARQEELSAAYRHR